MKIHRSISQHPADDVAIRFEGDVVTYGRLVERVEATARSLAARGVGRTDRVVYCGLARPEVFELLFACSRLGAVFVPLNSRLTATELRPLVDDSDPSLLLACDGLQSVLTEAGGSRPLVDLDAESLAVATESEALADSGHADSGNDKEGGADTGPVLMVYTSGTTGVPKGAVLSQRSLHHTVLNSIDHQDFTADDCVIACLPTFHVGGLNIQTLPVLHAGGEVLLMRRFDPAGVLELISQHRPTQTLLVPAMLNAVAGHPRFDEIDLSSLVGINSGSSLVPETSTAPFFARGVPVGQVYGATETGPTAVVLRYGEAAAHPGSCGRPALHTEVRVVDENGASLPAGQDGEIWLRGPNLFSGYWNKPNETDAAFVDDWYRTGDVGHQTADGFVYISDRIRDTVISGGENVYPAEVEALLEQHPDIAELTVVGRSDPEWGEIPVAVVVPTAGCSIELEALRSWCDGRLARFKQPRQLIVVDELPRTALGKVQKHLVRERFSSTD